jgi:hypothetical protein
MPFRSWVLPLSAALLVCACERKAPGPRECQAFAYRVLGFREAIELRDPRLRAAVDELMVKCLTVPYDRKLLSCVETSSQTQACLLDFRSRREGRQ